MKETIKLPRYIVEKVTFGFVIWDTHKHEYLPDQFEDKQKAGEKIKELEPLRSMVFVPQHTKNT